MKNHTLLNNSGFTLIELLLVIAIVAALSASSYLVVDKFVDTSSTTKLNSIYTNIKRSANLYVSMNETQRQTLSENNQTYVSLGLLETYNYIDSDIKNPVNNEVLSKNMLIKVYVSSSGSDNYLDTCIVDVDEGCEYTTNNTDQSSSTESSLNEDTTTSNNDPLFTVKSSLNEDTTTSNNDPLFTVKSSLSEYTWTEIKQLSDALVAGTITTTDLSDTYNIKIGFTKDATINGETHSFRLVGLMHDIDESGKTIGMTFEQTDLMNDYYKMYSNVSSSNGWTNSDLKRIINNFNIQSDLDVAITPAKKSCVTSVSNSSLTYVTSKLWIMSETEIAGTQNRTKGNVKEGNKYEYYTNKSEVANRAKTKNGYNSYYWLRSSNNWENSYAYFACINPGNPNNAGAVHSCNSNISSCGVSVCFCV